MVLNLFVTKNNQFEKVEVLELVYKDLLGNSFLFSRGDAVWKEKRQACAHAFYKDRLQIMCGVLKERIDAAF